MIMFSDDTQCSISRKSMNELATDTELDSSNLAGYCSRMRLKLNEKNW